MARVLPPKEETAGVTTWPVAANIWQAIQIMLETTPGEWFMRPTFGYGKRCYLAKPSAVNLISAFSQKRQRGLC